MKKVLKAATVALIAAVALTGCTDREIRSVLKGLDQIAQAVPEKPKPPVAVTSDAPVAQQLQELTISEPLQNMNTYTGNRNELYPHWLPVNTEFGWSEEDMQPGCDVRWYTLWRDSDTQDWYDRDSCAIGENTNWVDPYGYIDPDTGEAVFVASGDPADFDIDHIVALGDAHRSGAESLSLEMRTSLANDPLNVVVSGKKSNQKKNDHSPEVVLTDGDWYSLIGWRCEYATSYIQVKHKYDLTITQGDFNALANTLNNECPVA